MAVIFAGRYGDDNKKGKGNDNCNGNGNGNGNGLTQSTQSLTAMSAENLPLRSLRLKLCELCVKAGCLAKSARTIALRLLFADLQHCEEGFLRDIDLADALHALLALFLLVEQLALTRDVAAVALGDHVLADGRYRRAGNDL